MYGNLKVVMAISLLGNILSGKNVDYHQSTQDCPRHYAGDGGATAFP